VNDKARFIKKRKHARDKALQALYQWQLSGEDLDWIRDHYLQEQGVASGDEEYFLELLYQIPPQAEALDARYRNYVTNFEDHLDPIETNILRIATYELERQRSTWPRPMARTTATSSSTGCSIRYVWSYVKPKPAASRRVGDSDGERICDHRTVFQRHR
jgi:transcription termination factor NusB